MHQEVWQDQEDDEVDDDDDNDDDDDAALHAPAPASDLYSVVRMPGPPSGDDTLW